MNQYKNFDLTPGIGSQLVFDVADETGLPLDTTGFEGRIEVLNNDNSLRYVVAPGKFSPGLGKITATLGEGDTRLIGPGLLRYRLVLKNTSLVSSIVATGFFNVAEVPYDSTGTATGTIVLPGGSIYVGAPITLVLGAWYEISSYYRFLVSGTGILTLDLRNNVGTVTIRSENFTNITDDTVEWVPFMGPNTSFRINSLSGSCTVKFLP